MPGTLSMFAGVEKAGIALKPTCQRAWVLALSWTRLGAPGQALDLSHQGWSSTWKALGEREALCEQAGRLPTPFHHVEEMFQSLASWRKALNAC